MIIFVKFFTHFFVPSVITKYIIKRILLTYVSDLMFSPRRLVNESLQMLTRYPELNTKILPLMEDYLVALR